MKIPRLATSILVGPGLALAASACLAADWPHFRGPNRDAVSDGEGLLTAWSQGQPRQVWRRAIGGGFSSVTVVGDRIYTMAAEEGSEMVVCLDAASGETVWKRTVGEAKPETFPEGGPRATPTVAGGMLFAASSGGRLTALDAADGTPVWEKDLTQWGPAPRFGYSVSPLVDGEQVIVEAGKPGEAGGIVALDRETGEVRWTALDGPAGYSTPIVAEIGGVRQYVFYRRAGAAVAALSPEGEELWSHPTKGLAIIVSPIFVPPDRVFVATSDDVMGGLMLRVTRGEEGFAVEELWSERLMRNHFNASVLVGGHLYGFDNATFRCLDAGTGERRWAKRGLGKGSLIAAGDMLFVLADDGTLALVHATPEGYREAGRVQAMRGRSWTAPSLAGGRLYVRDFDEIASFDVSGSSEGVVVGDAPSARAAAAPTVASVELSAAEVIAAYVTARGGAERWRRLHSLRLTGSYAAFSESAPFTLLRRRGDLYRLDFTLLGAPAVRARDSTGTWGRHKLLKPEPGRIDEGPYKVQFERESLFEPPLLDYDRKGIAVELLGAGEIDGRPTIDLELTMADGRKETWHLDSETLLEAAVDSQVMDLTQLPEPMLQRAFYGDFREVDGLVLPHRIELEFGARLEAMTVDRVDVDPELDDALFAPPAAETENDSPR